MPNDRTMPPTEQPDAPSQGTGPAPAGDMAAPMPQDGGGDGAVMISMPKAAFDAMHALVAQLATGLDQLKQGVDKQAAGAGAPPSEMPPQAPAGGAQGGANDEDFLNSMAQEGSQK